MDEQVFVFNTDMFKKYCQEDVQITIQQMRALMQTHQMAHGYSMEAEKVIDYAPYFRIEGYKRRGKGIVHRVVRIRDGLVIHRLVKSKNKAEQAARLMVADEIKKVEKEIEKTILG